MKEKLKAATKKPNNGRGCACFELTHPSAQSVSVAGSFNDWQPAATPMIALGDGHWRTEINLPLGRYEYRLVVDGEWVDDPAAKETVGNPFGGLNAVLEVRPPDTTSNKAKKI